MELASINVSQPQQIEFNHTLISTGIFKKPIAGSVKVSQLNIAGDQQVDLINHGGAHKAVYGFSANHYDFWRAKLNNPAIAFGQFGENLTITDLDEAILCIGDQLQIGDCVLEISQPRVPCFKLGIAFSLNAMPALFIQHASTGIYFRVLQTGSITNGDIVSVIHQHPKRLAVQHLFKAYFDKSFANSEEIMRLASDIPQLSDEWRQKVQSRLKPS